MKTEQYLWFGLGVIFSGFLLVILAFLIIPNLRISFEETVALFALASIPIIVGFIITQLPRKKAAFSSHHK